MPYCQQTPRKIYLLDTYIIPVFTENRSYLPSFLIGLQYDAGDRAISTMLGALSSIPILFITVIKSYISVIDAEGSLPRRLKMYGVIARPPQAAVAISLYAEHFTQYATR